MNGKTLTAWCWAMWGLGIIAIPFDAASPFFAGGMVLLAMSMSQKEDK